jgi:hypothetical protein
MPADLDPRRHMRDKTEEIIQLLAECSTEERLAIFRRLRSEFHIHPIEDELNVQAEIILHAIHRASDLSVRGIRGLIAEASFELLIKETLRSWTVAPLTGDMPYDFLLSDLIGQVRVQVKMQRLENRQPKFAKRAWRTSGDIAYVVETQKTRSGKTSAGDSTRPYRFGEFDIIAVSMHPSTRDWSRFHYTVSSWLLPSDKNPDFINTFQPVQAVPDGKTWTGDFLTSVEWLRSGRLNKIWPPR